VHFFVSYSRADSEFVVRLARDLRQAGVRVWLDQLDIPIGQRWDEAVERALKECTELIVVLSPAAVGSTNVMDEVSYALGDAKLVVPVLLSACDVPFRLRRVQRIDFSSQEYAIVFKRLVSTLQQSSPSHEPRPGHTPQPAAAGLRDWKERLLDFKETFGEAEKEKALALVRFICEVLSARGWPGERVSVVDFAATEIVDNAFLHGLSGYPGRVAIDAHVTDRSCSIVVTDTGAGFDLQACLKTQRAAAPEDRHALAQIATLVSDPRQPGGVCTVQFTVLREAPATADYEYAGVYFLEWIGRIDANANVYAYRSAVEMAFARGQSLALDLSRTEYIGSVGVREMVVMARMAKAANLRVVAVAPPPQVRAILEISKVLGEIYPIVESREEAVARLTSRPDSP
jgi:anti-anti-sigma factor